jgi:Tfp pilus assembly protein PilO
MSATRAAAAVPLSRIIREHRAALLPLALVLAINIVVLAVVVWPLSQRVTTNESRAVAAERAQAVANADFKRVESALQGTARASTDLETFYGRILPTDITAARRMTHLRFQQKAREHGVRYQRGTTAEDPVEDSSLSRLSVSVALTGQYDDIRSLLYDLENSDDFFVIENVSLTEGNDEENELSVALHVSTYYRTAQVPAPPANGR